MTDPSTGPSTGPAAGTLTDPAAHERIRGHISVWEASCADALALLRSLDPADWDRPTELPGWDVRAVAAHLAHLESELAGRPQEQPAAG